MTYEEEKNMVADWLGWEKLSDFPPPDGPEWHGYQRQDETLIHKDLWNPKEGRNAWPEIWSKLTLEETGYMVVDYLQNLESILALSEEHENTHAIFMFHTATPEQCWQALITTLLNK